MHFLFLMGISMGKLLDLNIMSENDLNMIDLVITHLTHPWGSPLWFAALNSLPVVIFCHFRHSCKWPKLSFSGMYDQKWPLEVLCTGLFFCHRCVFAMSYSTPVVNRNAPTSHESDSCRDHLVGSNLSPLPRAPF